MTVRISETLKPLTGFRVCLGFRFLVSLFGNFYSRIIFDLFSQIGRRHCFVKILLCLLPQKVAIPF